MAVIRQSPHVNQVGWRSGKLTARPCSGGIAEKQLEVSCDAYAANERSMPVVPVAPAA
jgi:hypothetical protein